MRSLLNILSSLMLFTSCGPDLAYINYNEKEFNDVAKEIIAHPEIFQMDDFTRDQKRLNNLWIKLDRQDEDSSKILLSEAVDSLNLDPLVVNILRTKLEESKLRDFIQSGDTILFTVDGMLDTAWGFLYSKNNLTMDSTWFSFHGYTLRFNEDINKNWKRVSIK